MAEKAPHKSKTHAPPANADAWNPLSGNRLYTEETEHTWPNGKLTRCVSHLPELTFFDLTCHLERTCPLEGLDFSAGVVLVFVQRGGLDLRIHGHIDAHLGAQMHNAFFLTDAGIEIIAEELDIKAFIIHIAPRYFLQVAGECAAAWQAFTLAVQEGRPAQLLQAPLYIDIAIQANLQALQARSHAHTDQRLFFRAKALEMIALQAESEHRLHQPAPIHVKTDYDKERLLFARQYLQQNMATPPSLSKLALVAGINEFKLKRGFKELFGTTVFGYLAELRLELAKAELMEGRKTATEIAFELGYSSLQHFSSRFKDKYGVTPTELKRTQK